MLKIGTRKSLLAIKQTELVVQEIKLYYPALNIEIVPITTTGDLITNKNLYDIGGKALFLKELETALLENKIDLAVHSLKDVPGKLPQNLELAAVLKRSDERDVFISYKYKSLLDLPFNARVGSSSVRRKVIIQSYRPDLEIIMFRGNIQTRLKKLQNGEAEATILALAGLERLEIFDNSFCFPLSQDFMIPAIGQGIITIEIQKDNDFAREICNKVNHKATWDIIQVERSYIEYLDASCRTPLGAYAKYIDNNKIEVNFMMSDIDGKNIFYDNIICSASDARESGIKVAKRLFNKFK